MPQVVSNLDPKLLAMLLSNLLPHILKEANMIFLHIYLLARCIAKVLENVPHNIDLMRRSHCHQDQIVNKTHMREFRAHTSTEFERDPTPCINHVHDSMPQPLQTKSKQVRRDWVTLAEAPRRENRTRGTPIPINTKRSRRYTMENQISKVFRKS